MKRFLRRERCAFPHERNSLGFFSGAAFLGGFFGTLVWINGRGAWFVMRFALLPSFMPSLSLAYTLWLFVYGLLGGAIFLCLRNGRKWGKGVLTDGALLLGSYFLCLLWQPFFYTAYFLFLSLLTLVGAASLITVFLVRMLRRSFLLVMLGGFILLVQCFFIALTVCCF